MSWRYENYGTAELLETNWATTLKNGYTKFGLGINHAGSLYFGIPKDSRQIWAKFDVRFMNNYSDGDRLGFVHKNSEHGACGFGTHSDLISENSYLFVNEKYSSRPMNNTSFSKHSVHTFLVHLCSNPTTGIVEMWIDGVRTEQSVVGVNVNDGLSLDNVFLFVAHSMIISNIIISDAKIGLDENVSMNNLGLRYIFPEFEYKNLIAGYNLEEISQSTLKYNESVKSLADILLKRIKDYELCNEETIRTVNSASFQLEKKYVDSPTLTEEENNLLKERQIFLCEHLRINIGELKNKILNVKSQIEQQEKRIDEINCHENFLEELTDIQNSKRPNFPFVIDNFLRMIRQSVDKINFFNKNREFVTSVINHWVEWTDNYKSFKTNKREGLTNICHDDGIDDEIFNVWYEDWQKKRFAIEQRFLPLVNFALNGNLLNEDNVSALAERVLEILKGYKDQVDNFYLNERKNIYQKFAFQAGGDLQEKFETESELYKLTENLQSNLTEIIFSRDQTAERLFLLDWTKPLLNLPIDEIIDFVEEKKLSAISAEVLGQFAELKRQNFATYIADSKAYSEALKRRENEYNALVFRMRKDLNKK